MKVSANIIQIRKNPLFKLIFYSYQIAIISVLLFITSLLVLPLLGYMEIWHISLTSFLILGFVFNMINLEIEKRIKYFDYVGTITFDNVKWQMIINVGEQNEMVYDLYEIKSFRLRIKGYTHTESWGKLVAYFNGVNNYVEFVHENERYKYYFHLDDDEKYYNFVIIRDLLYPVRKII